MKLINPENPVRYSWLTDQNFRLDASPYLSGAYEAKKLLERLTVPTVALKTVTSGFDGGIFNGPKFSRIWVTDPKYGVPFVGSTDMLEADFSWLPLLHRKIAARLSHLEVQPGMTLISCSGNIGRMTYVRPDMAGFWSSQHTMKVCADRKKIPSGYLFAFLCSKYGVPMITSQASGSIIQHIDPRHIADLPVPRFSAEVEGAIHELIQEAANLRAQFQDGVTTATRDLFASAGLPEIVEMGWHDQPRDLGFAVQTQPDSTLRALNYSPRSRRIIDLLMSVPHRWLGDLCADGELRRGNRFIRVDSSSGSGIKLIGQRQGFWMRPEGRWIALKDDGLAQVRVADETVLVAARGTLGENEVYCRSLFVTGSWCRNAYSEDFLRVVSGDPGYPGAYLFAFLRAEAMFRVLRSMSTGSKQQDIHEGLRRQIPVPECTPEDRLRIAETVRQAYRWRDEADAKEDEALALLDDAVREAAR